MDLDIYAKDVLAPGKQASMSVLKRYGQQVLEQSIGPKNRINRKALSHIIFNDPIERSWLEQLIHPIVIQRLQDEINAQQYAPVIAIIIPLLFEAGLTALCSEVWVVKCTAAQQLKRLIRRDHLTHDEAQQRIKSQWPLDQKIRLADIVIDNCQGKEIWKDQVEELI